MDAFEEYKQVTHGMSEEGFVAYPLVQAVIEELNSWQAEDEPDMVRVQRERAEQAEADTEYHKGQAKLWHTALQDALTRADEAEAALKDFYDDTEETERKLQAKLAAAEAALARANTVNVDEVKNLMLTRNGEAEQWKQAWSRAHDRAVAEAMKRIDAEAAFEELQAQVEDGPR